MDKKKRVRTKKNPYQYSILFNKSYVDPLVLKFADMQANFSDTVAYLIEKEIEENGFRNLQMFIPPVRKINNVPGVNGDSVSSEVVSTVTNNITSVEVEYVEPMPGQTSIEEVPSSTVLKKENLIEDPVSIPPIEVKEDNHIHEKVEVSLDEEEFEIPPEYEGDW